MQNGKKAINIDKVTWLLCAHPSFWSKRFAAFNRIANSFFKKAPFPVYLTNKYQLA